MCEKVRRVFAFQVELSSSFGKVGLISEKDFNDIKKKYYDTDSEDEHTGSLMPPRSSNAITVAASPEKNGDSKQPMSVVERVKEVSANILSSTELHVDAPVFKPKLRTESASIPSSSTTPNKHRTLSSKSTPSKSRAQKNMPRFFPAIVKEDVQNKVNTSQCKICCFWPFSLVLIDYPLLFPFLKRYLI